MMNPLTCKWLTIIVALNNEEIGLTQCWRRIYTAEWKMRDGWTDDMIENGFIICLAVVTRNITCTSEASWWFKPCSYIKT
jgi:hypothetical protein